jgi:hypothetical protein
MCISRLAQSRIFYLCTGTARRHGRLR